jgi:hypothetical protein
MHQQLLPIPSLIAQNLMFQPAVLLLLFQALTMFCGHMFSQPLLDLDQCSLSQHTGFIPELLMVCTEQEICICINEQNNSRSHRSVASRPIEWQRETQGHVYTMYIPIHIGMKMSEHVHTCLYHIRHIQPQ